MKKIITRSEKETINFGKKIGKNLKGKEVIGLIGELGAGKTILTKGIAQGLGIKKIIKSPSFIVMKIYKTEGKSGIKNFCHLDAYRILGEEDLIKIGVKDWLAKPKTVTVIEWADRVKKILPKNKMLIKLKIIGKNKRLINIYGKNLLSTKK